MNAKVAVLRSNMLPKIKILVYNVLVDQEAPFLILVVRSAEFLVNQT